MRQTSSHVKGITPAARLQVTTPAAAPASGLAPSRRAGFAAPMPLLAAILALGAACSRQPLAAPAPAPVPAPATGAVPAPWSAPHLQASRVPPVYRQVWSDAQNRASCALVAPASLGAGTGAVPRPASFSGGWSVAYDTPDTRSAFGIAGTGSLPSSDTYDGWPNRVQYTDGSWARYGPEGGTGPNQLAYVRIATQGCLYNVWSRLGVAHLEHLLAALRFVETP